MRTLINQDIRNPVPASVPQQFYRNVHRSIRVGSLLLLDCLMLLGAVAASHVVRAALLATWFGPPSLSLGGRLKLFPVYLIIQLLLFSQFKLYGQGDERRNYQAIFLATAIGIGALYVGSRLYPPHAHPSFLWVLLISGSLFLSLGRLAIDQSLAYLRRNGIALYRTLLIGKRQEAMAVFNRIQTQSTDLVGLVSPTLQVANAQANGYLGSLGYLEEVLRTHRVQEVILTEELDRKELMAVFNSCVNQGANLKILLPSFTGISNPVAVRTQKGQFLLEIVQPRMGISQFALKRAFDIMATALGLIIISPLLVLIALAIKLDSPGPVFFKQQRITVKGRPFWMYKFRSMQVDAEAQLDKIIHLNERKDNLMFKVKHDPRITRVGRFLRRTSLDELPQLFNVLLGEMSLVGPRPPLPREVDNYAPHHRQRLEVLPGITGLWQVSGRSDITDFEEVVRLDLTYIQDWSIWLDFKILFRTIPAVLSSRGAS
ncbi:MAG TPA: sugar transferase [Stenomitos sp.]